MTNGGAVDGPWISCPWCASTVPLTYFAESDEEPGAQDAVCEACGRRVSFLPPVPPDEPGDQAPSAAA